MDANTLCGAVVLKPPFATREVKSLSPCFNVNTRPYDTSGVAKVMFRDDCCVNTKPEVDFCPASASGPRDEAPNARVSGRPL